MEYKIEKGIKAPDRTSRGGIINLIKSMEIGDSFLGNQSVITNMRSTVLRRELPHKFAGKQTEDGYRVWLISK